MTRTTPSRAQIDTLLASLSRHGHHQAADLLRTAICGLEQRVTDLEAERDELHREITTAGDRLADMARSRTDWWQRAEAAEAALAAASHRIDRIRDAARLHRQHLIGLSDLYAVIEAMDAPAPAGTEETHTKEQ